MKNEVGPLKCIRRLNTVGSSVQSPFSEVAVRIRKIPNLTSVLCSIRPPPDRALVGC